MSTETQPQNGTTAVAPAPAKKEIRVVHDESNFRNILDTSRYEHLWRLANTFAASSLVPDSFRDNAPNCFIGIQMALRCGVDPFMFLQKMYVVHGRPALESTLAIALANASGVFKTRISYEIVGSGDARHCTASATMSDNGEVVRQVVSVATAKAMGWWTKKDSLWPKMTDLMLQYRSAMWLIRTNCPEVIMGMLSKEEAGEMAEERLTEPRQAKALEDLRALVEQPIATVDPAAIEQAGAAPETDRFGTSQDAAPAREPGDDDADEFAPLDAELAAVHKADSVRFVVSNWIARAPDDEFWTQNCRERGDKRVAELRGPKQKALVE